MHLAYTPEQERLCRQLREYFAGLMTPEVRRGLAARFDRHRAIARWTFPIWLYVSVTGVVVYVMLYHM